MNNFEKMFADKINKKRVESAIDRAACITAVVCLVLLYIGVLL